MDLSEKPQTDKKQSAETIGSKVTPSMEEKESYHPPDALHHGYSSEKTRIQNTTLSGKKAGCPAPI